jgi:hypothetical protein
MAFDPTKPVTHYNRLVEVEFATNDRPNHIQSACFGTEQEAADFINGFDYSSGHIIGYSGHISEELLTPLPEIMEYKIRGVDPGTPVGEENVRNTLKSFNDDPNYWLNIFKVPGGKMVVPFRKSRGKNTLYGYAWFIPYCREMDVDAL